MNLADLVRINALNQPNRTALVQDDTAVSYAEAWQRIESMAAALHEAGVAPGDRVGLVLADHAPHLLLHYAVARLGAVILPVDHRWTASEKSAALTIFRAAIAVTEGDAVPGISTLTLDEATAAENFRGLPPMPRDRHADLLVSLSSGTTGKPKGALVSHANLYERFVSQWTTIGYDARDRFALVTPLCFGAGRSFGMCMLAAGGSVRLAPPPLKSDELLRELSRTDISAAFLPPTLLRRLLPLAKTDGRPVLGHIDYLLVSGEPLHAEEAADCRLRICPNLVGYYASSEGGGISVLASGDFAEHAATVGRPTFRTEVEIVGSDRRPLPQGEVGRLRYRGPGVATRFVDADGKEQAGAEGGWFYPGDLAKRLPDGFIALQGRDTDVIIRGGINVYPAEIEAALRQQPEVGECAVIGADDPARGQIVVAFVTGHAGTDALEAHCRERLAPYKLPEKFVRLDELPKAGSGKIDRKKLAELIKP